MAIQRFALRPPSLLGSLLIILAFGCTGGGGQTSGDHAGQINNPYLITPPIATVTVGETCSFTVASPWGGGTAWSVIPASGGSMDATGKFTASFAQGKYQIVALWNNDVRYTATATVTVVPLPPPAHLSTGLVQAYGHNRQVSPDGSIQNATIAGEPVPAKKAASENGTFQARHGFYPPPPR